MRLRRSLAALATAALLLGPVIPTAAYASQTAQSPAEEPSPAPSGSTTWAIAPGGELGTDGRVSLRHVLDPGASVSDQVLVTNFSEKPALFRIYPSDGVMTAEGNFDVQPPTETPVDGGSWIVLGEVAGGTPETTGGTRVEIPAGGSVVVPVEITVPADASPGDHPAGIVAELLQEGDSPVQFSSRVGVRAHLRVSGDVIARVVPENIQTSYQPSWNPFAPGTLVVTYDLTNDGNVRLGGEADTQASGFFGLVLASDSTEVREVLPGQFSTVTEELTVWPLFFTWGEITATPTAVGDDAFTVELEPTVTDFTAWTIPWSQLIILLLIAGIVFLIVWQRKRSRVRTQEKIDAAAAAAVAAVKAQYETAPSGDNTPSKP